MKIKVKSFNPNVKTFDVIDKGDWIDLYASEDVTLVAPQAGVQYEQNGSKFRDVSFDSKLIPLNVAMALPKGYEAIVALRSSTYKNYKVMQTNSIGVIDNTYCGDEDQWKLPVVSFAHTTIPQNARVCQFRIQLSQKATVWQKIKWLFTSKIKFEWVDSLNNESRGGFGSTGK